jgi:hypothetical protein
MPSITTSTIHEAISTLEKSAVLFEVNKGVTCTALGRYSVSRHTKVCSLDINLNLNQGKNLISEQIYLFYCTIKSNLGKL